MDPVRLFAEIVAQRGKVAKVRYEGHSALDDLLTAGLVETSGLVSSVLCNDCGTPHAAEIVFDDVRYGYFCPELGFVERNRSTLVALWPNLEAFTTQLAKSLNCKRTRSRAIFGETWRIGSIDTPKGDLVLYYHPTLRDARDAQALGDALQREVNYPFGLILTAAGSLSQGGYRTVGIIEALHFETNRLQFEVTIDRWAAAGVPVTNKGGRPNAFGLGIQALITTRRKAGLSLDGVNSEARAILEEIKAQNPDGPHPPFSSVKGYVGKARGRQ